MRFLQRGTEHFFARGERISKHVPDKVWYVCSGKVVYRIHHGKGKIIEIPCGASDLAGIVEVCASSIQGGAFEIEALEDSVLYGWSDTEFSMALGMYQELAVQVIKKLSSILRAVNAAVRGVSPYEKRKD